MDSNLRRGMRDFGGVPVPSAGNSFIMPAEVDYGPGDPVYEAIATHFDPEIWNGLESDAQISVIESLEESMPQESAPSPVSPSPKSALPFGPAKGRPRV